MDFKNKKILVVVAHPDDELLGLGATMYKLINKYNCKVRVVILGEGILIPDRIVNKNTKEIIFIIIINFFIIGQKIKMYIKFVVQSFLLFM